MNNEQFTTDDLQMIQALIEEKIEELKNFPDEDEEQGTLSIEQLESILNKF